MSAAVFASVKRKFYNLPDPPGFSISCTPASYARIFQALNHSPSSVLYEVGCGKGYLMLYALVCGIRTVQAMDIEQPSVDRSRYALEQCTVDPRFSSMMLGADVKFSTGDGLLMPLPEGVTIVSSIVAWTMAQFETMLQNVIDSRCLHWVTLIEGFAQWRMSRVLLASF